MPRITFLGLAEAILLKSKKPMTSREIWETAVKSGLEKRLESKGLTQWDSMSAALVVDTRDNPRSAIVRMPGRPARYSLRDSAETERKFKDIDFPSITSIEPELGPQESQSETKNTTLDQPYLERDLHRHVSWFADWKFGAALTKTIPHQKAYKKNFAQWLYPDLVGFWYPFHDYNSDILGLTGSGLTLARFYSFELKREITLGNLRESFFQAVSNSSWAHEGYLVAANIDENGNLRKELGRLSGSFGIGVIELDLEELENSQILFPAKRKLDIDWDGANKLAMENPVFSKFLKSVRFDIDKCYPHPAEYDPVPTKEDLVALWTTWKSDDPLVN